MQWEKGTTVSVPFDRLNFVHFSLPLPRTGGRYRSLHKVALNPANGVEPSVAPNNLEYHPLATSHPGALALVLPV